ncbi:MAG: hypothetical protein JW765_08535 [Deltaproteobacteria bacterium]|nr:hypothetical protein [Candidatus Zymogenaceae bacterium]
MKKQRFSRRFFSPVFLIFVIMSISWGVYNLAWRLGNVTVHHLLADIFGTLLFLSVTFGTCVVYPMAFLRGASLPERVLASLVNPLIWATKECIRMFGAFSLTESLYYYCNPLNIWLLLGIIAQMSIIEMILRHRRKKAGENIRVFSIPVVAAFVISMALVVGLYAWGRGENIFSSYLVFYKTLFGPGVGLSY